MSKKIVLLISKYHESNNMIQNASEIIRNHGGVLYLIYVIKMKMDVSVDAEVENLVEEGENYLDEATQTAKLPRSSVETQLLQSRDIGSAIIYESNLINPDIIYLGQNKNYDYEKFFLDEDIKYIFENANCDVVFFYNKSK
tara:strand:+ start:47 stop:469 length:423 start_codon:yes stop_codon:yes gene_type:complete